MPEDPEHLSHKDLQVLKPIPPLKKTNNPCSLFTLAYILERFSRDEFTDKYYELAQLGKEGIINHPLNTNGLGYEAYIAQLRGAKIPLFERFVYDNVYSPFRDLAFRERTGEKPHGTRMGEIVTFQFTHGPLKALRHAAIDATVIHLENHPDEHASLRQTAEAYPDDSRALAFLKDTTDERLVEQRETETARRQTILYKAGRLYQELKHARRS
jgi:hypothetical protein